jgi:hypothetical protein
MTLVLITSIIVTPNNPLSYTSTRSIYSSEERFEQTKKTFETIRHYLPNSTICLVECSQLTNEQHHYFEKNADYFLNLYDKEEIRKNLYSESKSLCEGTMTIHALKYILMSNIRFNKLIKISGRYWLSENFDPNYFEKNDIIVKLIDNNNINIFTALYQLPKIKVIDFYNYLINNLNRMHNCEGYELIFASFINSISDMPINNLNPIGLAGYLSVSTDFYNG